ncbi:hypothetical protein [Vibrio phage vB_VpaP_SJSY21]|nr:hypothetical protein [Vibrio phage vB_VpaP_SJSY21]
MKLHKTGALPRNNSPIITPRKKITGLRSLTYKGVKYLITNVDYIADGEIVKQESIYRPESEYDAIYALKGITAR